MLTSVKVAVVTTFPAGVKLRLVDGQAAVRAHRLQRVGKGLYTVRDPVQFKAGELLDVDLAALPKALRDGLEPLPKTDAKAA